MSLCIYCQTCYKMYFSIDPRDSCLATRQLSANRLLAPSIVLVIMKRDLCWVSCARHLVSCTKWESVDTRGAHPIIKVNVDGVGSRPLKKYWQVTAVLMLLGPMRLHRTQGAVANCGGAASEFGPRSQLPLFFRELWGSCSINLM